jgi:hypothetical protein
MFGAFAPAWTDSARGPPPAAGERPWVDEAVASETNPPAWGDTLSLEPWRRSGPSPLLAIDGAG